MIEFVGRERELESLTWLSSQVSAAIGGTAPGQCVQMRGRRRIGKSSLVEEFLRRTRLSSVFFTAERRDQAAELAALWQAVVESGVDRAGIAGGVTPADWSAALHTLAAILPDDEVTVLVIDEVPYLMEQVPAFEGILQKAWDRHLRRKPVLLILVGSDLGMMEALNSYDRPFHQRGREMVIGPLNPADVATMTGLGPAEAFDATMVTGGLPLIAAEWSDGADLWEFLAQALANPVSALVVSAERVLAAEFPQAAQPRVVLRAIGSGERTFGNIATSAGGMAHSSLNRSLEILLAKRIVAADVPVATHPSRERRYRVTDPYLRFWLMFIEPNLHLIERRRSDVVIDQLRRQWTTWRGRAVEPLVRESLARLLPLDGVPDAPVVGSYWTRTNDLEIDIVGADRAPVAAEVRFLGSIKWLEQRPFDAHDLRELVGARQRMLGPDATAPLIAVSRSGVGVSGVIGLGPEELLGAWRQADRSLPGTVA